MADVNTVIPIIALSFFVSGMATLIGAAIGIPVGTMLGMRRFRGKRFFKTVVFTFYGFPPVVMGLIIFLLLSSSGPLGQFRLLFTPGAMVLAETLLVLPLIIGITMSSVGSLDAKVRETIYALGASKRQAILLHLREARNGIMTAIMVGFGAAISEVGAAMMVGGNIEGQTRVLTTAIVLETRMGDFETAILLGAVLLISSSILFFFLMMMGEKDDE